MYPFFSIPITDVIQSSQGFIIQVFCSYILFMVKH